MSYSREQLEAIENARADFDTAVQAGQWTQAKAIVDGLAESGFVREAVVLGEQYVIAQKGAPITYEPVEAVVPLWSRAEHRAWDEPEQPRSEPDPRLEEMHLKNLDDQIENRFGK